MRFLLCFLCFLSLVFANYEKQIAEFDSKFASSNNKVAFHHQLQNLYIQSIINDDDVSKVKLLKRLVISSNALNLDDSAYVDELKAYQVSEAEIKNLQTALTSKGDEKPQKTNAQPLKEEGQNSQKTNAKILKKENSTQNSQESKAKDLNTKEPNTQSSSSKKIFVLNAKQEENKLILSLNENIEEKDLIKAELKEKDKYRYIIDFQAALDTGRKEFQFKDSKFLLAQFNPQTTRLVLYATQKPEFELSLKDKELIIVLKNEAENKAKETQQNKQIQAKEKSQEKQTAKKEAESPVKVVKPKEQELKNSAKDEKKDENKKLYILKNAKEDNGIRLTLNDEMKEAEISSFEMKDKDTYRLIFDFEAVLEGGRKNYTFDKNSITLTQYTPKTVRIVLNSPSKIKPEKEFEKKSFFIGFEDSGAKTSKTQSKTIQSANKTSSNSAKSSTTTKTAQSQKSSTSSYKANSNKIIVIDAGHGGKDAGAVGGSGKWLEKNVVLSVSLKVGEELKKRGYKVFYTRTNDKFINLKDRTKIANNKKANLFISIHANAAPNAQKAKQMQGIETFFLSPARSERSKEVASKENKTDLEEANFFLKQNFLGVLSREKIIASNRLAIDIQKNLLASVRKSHKVVDGGVREGPFWVLVGAQDMPAVLVELGYISHPDEGKKLTQRAYQDLLARGIANGVQNYFANNP